MLLFKNFFDICVYVFFDGQSWSKPALVTTNSVQISAGSISLHYGQSIFEGMLCFRGWDGRLRIFRLADHLARLQASAARMCMPVPDVRSLGIATTDLLRFVEPSISKTPGTLTYLRPVFYATDDQNLGVRASETYQLVVLACPLNAAIRHQDDSLILSPSPRAYAGGTGAAKTASNYAGALLSKQWAKDQGYNNVLFPDESGQFVEEAVANNIFFIKKDEVLTPPLHSSTILPGVTRASVISLLRDAGHTVTDNRRISVRQITDWATRGTLQHAFTTGTAGGLSQVVRLRLRKDTFLSNGESPLLSNARKELERIQFGLAEDVHNWLTTL